MGEGKVAVSGRIDPELLTWIDKEVKKRRFRTRSHALEHALCLLKEESENVRGTTS